MILIKNLNKIFKSIFDVEFSKYHLNDKLEKINDWDSFNVLNLISEIESNFGIVYTNEEIMDIVTFKDLKESIEEKTKKN